MFLHLRSTLRHWMLLPAAFLFVVTLPVFTYIAYALWTLDLARLLLGSLVLAGYCLVALLVVKICILVDEQILRHERLKPDAHGHYEQPLKKQPEPALQFELALVGRTEYEGCPAEHGIPLTDKPFSHERGYVAQR